MENLKIKQTQNIWGGSHNEKKCGLCSERYTVWITDMGLGKSIKNSPSLLIPSGVKHGWHYAHYKVILRIRNNIHEYLAETWHTVGKAFIVYKKVI